MPQSVTASPHQSIVTDRTTIAMIRKDILPDKQIEEIVFRGAIWMP
jgi:hypothetical protein